MISGRSTQHILQMLNAPQSIEYHTVQAGFPQAATFALAADANVLNKPLQNCTQQVGSGPEAMMQQAMPLIREFA